MLVTLPWCSSALRSVPFMQFLWSATLGRRTTKNSMEEQDNEDRASQATHRTSSGPFDSSAGGRQERSVADLSRHDEPLSQIFLRKSSLDRIPDAFSHSRCRISYLEVAGQVCEEGREGHYDPGPH